MSRDELIQIAELKSSPRIRTANHVQPQRSRGSFVSAENLAAIDFLFAIEAHQARPHRSPSGR